MPGKQGQAIQKNVVKCDVYTNQTFRKQKVIYDLNFVSKISKDRPVREQNYTENKMV